VKIKGEVKKKKKKGAEGRRPEGRFPLTGEIAGF